MENIYYENTVHGFKNSLSIMMQSTVEAMSYRWQCLGHELLMSGKQTSTT